MRNKKIKQYLLCIFLWLLAIILGWFHCQSRGLGWYFFILWIVLMIIMPLLLLKNFKEQNQKQKGEGKGK
ncbi:MAG: hypothetical protein ACYSXD_11325 [Planctomycetota bacterium]|jgi:L-asparagine transporter-like permease